MHRSDLDKEELRGLRVVEAGNVHISPPPVTHAVPDSVLEHLESMGLIERVTEPSLPLEVKRVCYRLTARGRAVLYTS